ncbi:nickel/cobalt transporter [Pseudopelagicola sp. nBUS_19]|mgnify:CR=1 FL=1|uniref:nickel/cobalt transporter n=1 Tax=Pseudopelagicola sp. nBUS_19 TaxID=3395316 RepID=UPI003EBFA2CA
MWLRFVATFLSILAVCVAVLNIVPWMDIQRWAVGEQRTVQNAMAGALRGIQAGDPLAVWTLCSTTAAYGFFHALGPGHGKVLIGGAALVSGVTLKRLSILTVLSSLAQAGTAIFLVGSLYLLFQVSSEVLVNITDAWLASASYAAITAIGAVLVFRGMRILYKLGQAKQIAHGCCGHAHYPSVKAVQTLTSARDVVALIVSIGVRPCTGALFVLVIAARFDAFAVGCLAVVTMGLGTAAFNLTMATSGVAARQLAGLGAHNQESMQAVSATLHVTGGVLIIAISLGMLLPYLS